MTRTFNWLQDVQPLAELSADTTDNGRFYSCPGGLVFPSVTTVLSVIEKEGLTKWKERVGEEEAGRIVRQAGVRGSAVHEMAEKYLRGEDWKAGQMPANYASFLPIKKVLDENVDNIRYMEAPLYSTFLRTAGRVDLVAEWQKEEAIIDFKTSRINKTDDLVENYFMQESAYAVMIEERTGKPITKLVTIMTSDDSPNALVWVRHRDEWIKKFMKARKAYYEIHGK